MKSYMTWALLLGVTFFQPAMADTVNARCNVYPAGSDQATATLACTFSQRQGIVHIVRSDGVEYELNPRGDQPGQYSDGSGQPAYRQKDLGEDGLIFRLKNESVFVYWDGEADTECTEAGFDETYEWQYVTFRVCSRNNSSLNRLTVDSTGLEIDNSLQILDIDGSVTNAEVADLDSDGFPEIYVYVNSAGSGAYGSVIGYAVNHGKSLSGIYMAPITSNAEHSAGYMGHDEFATVESNLVRRFPIYLEGDSNASPSGGMRQLQYKLSAGEAGWVLKVERVVEF